MKQPKLIISVLLALMFLTPISLKAQISFTVGDINYWITDTDAKEIRVDKYVGSDDILTLPVPGTVTYDNQEFTVTSIGANAFSNCNSLKEINIPSSVTSIGDRAFEGCNNLSEITIPSSVTSIGEQAFYDCTNLTKVNIPEGVTSIGDYTFYECKSLSEITIPSSVTSIGNTAFSGCTNLAEVNISEGVTSIEYEAFMACSGLKTITLPNSITSIGEKAFYDCGLRTITLPDKITNIGYEAFKTRFSLDTLITLSENPPTLDDEVFLPNSDMVVFVPKGCETTYQNAEGWKDFEIKIIIENPVTSITLNTEQLTMEYGTKEQLTATVAPDYADYPGLTWTSDNEEVATVDGSGLVTAVSEGTATITATANDGSDVSASCVVTVTFIDGIADVETSKVTVLAVNGRITVSGKEQDETVSVYDMGGRLLYQGESDVIDVPRKAMYIVTVSGKSYKVVVQ